jgi:GAF domain-containing protein
MVARTVSELRAALPEADDLLAGLLRVAEATRMVLAVDGAGLTLVHENDPPRWVAATDAAMELLEQVQHDFGEGPYLQAYAQDQAVAVEDLRAAPTWAGIDAVVGQLQVRGVLSVPIRLAGQPVGTLDVYSTQPRAWTAHELAVMAEFATVTAELVHTSVALAGREVEVAQQQLRARARASSRNLAELAREVVQDAQRQRLAALALDDARIRAAEARAQAAEQALQAAQAELAQRRAALDQAQSAADKRERAADDRDRVADERDRIADKRDRTNGP